MRPQDLFDRLAAGYEYDPMYGALCNERDQLKDENAKLRELLLDVWNDACEFDGFWDYVHDDGEIYCEDVLPHYQERMRELGIEVD